jgi:hypothetical protein
MSLFFVYFKASVANFTEKPMSWSMTKYSGFGSKGLFSGTFLIFLTASSGSFFFSADGALIGAGLMLD